MLTDCRKVCQALVRSQKINRLQIIRTNSIWESNDVRHDVEYICSCYKKKKKEKLIKYKFKIMELFLSVLLTSFYILNL